MPQKLKQFYFIFLRYFILLIMLAAYNYLLHAEDQHIVEEFNKALKTGLLNCWYPPAIDTLGGGFLSDLSYDWKPDGMQNKFLVGQARHVWASSQAALFYHNNYYLNIARHGFKFLINKMWDKEYGGFYMLRDREGLYIDNSYRDEKRAYGNAFAIYALAVYFKVSGDSTALNYAKKTFYWLDKYSHDCEYNGYFEHMFRNGSLLKRDQLQTTAFDSATIGYKDYNSSIHLLEAFTELYKVWPDSLLRKRLIEMLSLIRDTFTSEKGYLILHFRKDWTPVSCHDSPVQDDIRKYQLDHVSFGHDVETAYLMLEASHTLGLSSDMKTLNIARKMVDHSLKNGWDNEKGGFYYSGHYHNDSDHISIINKMKSWWVQAEGLNALLLMSRLFPDEETYYRAFKQQWEYINNYLIDHENGGWYINGLDENPEQSKAPKAYIWKTNYHNLRSLINCIKMLKYEHELIE